MEKMMLRARKSHKVREWLESHTSKSLVGLHLGKETIVDQARIYGNTCLLVKNENQEYQIFIETTPKRFVPLSGKRKLLHKSELTDYNNWLCKSTFSIDDQGNVTKVFPGPRTFELWSQDKHKVAEMIRKYKNQKKKM